jgi:benzil reductase ((S)-benzoin forming)
MPTPTSPRLAVVTGTSSGVGLAATRILLERGWTVCGIARRPAPVSHDRYQHLALDLSDVAGLDRVIADRLGPLFADPRWTRVGLVNNAAVATLLGPVGRFSGEDMAANYAVNLVAPVALMGAAGRLVPPTTPLTVVNVSSGAAGHPFPGGAAYCSGKAALRMAGMVAAEEWKSTAPHAPTRAGSAVVCYEPGVVDTPMQTYARGHSETEFPWVAPFKEFEARGIAVQPDKPATQIADFLDRTDLPPFTEARL